MMKISFGCVLKNVASCFSGKKSGDVTELQIGVKGKLTDGTVFDSSFERGDPIEFELGSRQVIKGLNIQLEGVSGGIDVLVKISQVWLHPNGSNIHVSCPVHVAAVILNVALGRIRRCCITEKKDADSNITSELLSSSNGNFAISIEFLREVTNNFSEYNILGKGGFGVLYIGKLNDGTQLVVERMESANEFEYLTTLRHRHLVALLGFCVHGNERILVYEHSSKGTLGQHLFHCYEMGVPPLTWKERVTIALDIANGVDHLHNMAWESFIHGDLKSSNILLEGHDMRAKVSISGLVKNMSGANSQLGGTIGHLAPECTDAGGVTTEMDVFAFGVILIEIITGSKALEEDLSEDRSHLVSWFRRLLVNRESIKDSLDPSVDPDDETFESIWKVAKLAGHCTFHKPFRRPTMSQVVNVLSPFVHPWKPTNN